MSETRSAIPLRSAARQKGQGSDDFDATHEITKLREECARLRAQLDERDRTIHELREENKFLRLPKVAQRRHREQQQKENRRRTQQINNLKNDLHRQVDMKRGSISAGSSFASSPGSTNASTPADFEPNKKFHILKEAPSRQTIQWEEGFMTTNTDYFRRSQKQLQALQEFLSDHIESLSSEDSIPLETPRFRSINKSDSGDGLDAEMEDLSDACFTKRHSRLEAKERNLVNSDKRHQVETKKREMRERSRDHKEEEKIDELYSGSTLQKIEMIGGDEIPLTIFGSQVPSLASADFKLPWLTTQEEIRRERSHRRSRARTNA